MQYVDFLTNTLKGSDAVYLIKNIFEKEIDFPTEFSKIAGKYQQAMKQSGVKKVVHFILTFSDLCKVSKPRELLCKAMVFIGEKIKQFGFSCMQQ